jgi:DNA-binding FadR family transcriptional regulator
LTEFRQFVEPGVAELAALRRTDEDIKALQANIDYCEKVTSEGKIELAKHLEFHRLLANACHNKLISGFMEAVTKVHEDLFGKLKLTSDVGIQDLEYNKKFLECLVHRDRDRIRKLMVSHFDIFKELYDSNQSQSEEASEGN